MPIIAYINISSRSRIPRLAIDGRASTSVLKMIYSFLNFLKILRILPILIDLRMVD